MESRYEFRLTTIGVVRRLSDHFGVIRSTDAVRMWGRMGRLPVFVLENGQRLYRQSDVDELGAQLARRDAKAHRMTA